MCLKLPSLHHLQLYGLYKGGEGKSIELSSLMEAVGGGEEGLHAEQFTR